MSKTDHELNARLAKWMEWEAATAFDPLTGRRTKPPLYDTDPAATLKLLDWLTSKGWVALHSVEMLTSKVHTKVEFRTIEGGYTAIYSKSIVGPPSEAWPIAVATAADTIREMRQT